MFRRLNLIAVFILSLSSIALAATTPDCKNRFWGEIEAHYCVAPPQGGDSDSVLVYFHGLGGDENEWFQNTALQQVHKDLIGKKFDPWIVTISFGPGWLLTDVPGGYLLFPKTMDELLPDVLKSIKPAGFAKRILVGASMGGFNTSQVLLKRPDQFDKFLLICPAITTVGPYASEMEIDDYIRRTGANPSRIAFMLQWGRMEFPTVADWDAHDPLAVAAKVTSLPKAYISCGTKDDYGFQEGSEAFYQAIKSKARQSVWVPVKNGKHCAADIKTIVKFITEPRTLEGSK